MGGDIWPESNVLGVNVGPGTPRTRWERPVEHRVPLRERRLDAPAVAKPVSPRGSPYSSARSANPPGPAVRSSWATV